MTFRRPDENHKQYQIVLQNSVEKSLGRFSGSDFNDLVVTKVPGYGFWPI